MLGATQKFHSTSLSLDFFEYLSFVVFDNWTLLANKMHCVSFVSFHFNNIPIKPKITVDLPPLH